MFVQPSNTIHNINKIPKPSVYKTSFLNFLLTVLTHATISCGSSSDNVVITDGTQDPTMPNDDNDDSENLSGPYVAVHGQLRIAGTRIVDKEGHSAALMPGAIAEGVWKTDELTQSGTIVRDEIKANNPHYND